MSGFDWSSSSSKKGGATTEVYARDDDDFDPEWVRLRHRICCDPTGSLKNWRKIAIKMWYLTWSEIRLQTPAEKILAPHGTGAAATPTTAISKEEQPGSWIPSTPDGSTHASEASSSSSSEEKGSVPITNLDYGWRPWKVVIGAFCLIVPTYGLLSSIGLFQTEWERHQLQGYSKSEISWIISIFGFFGCFFAAPCGILYDRYGPRLLLMAGSTIYVASFIGLAFSSTYGQFMACFIVAGVSSGMYFSSRRTGGHFHFFIAMSANVRLTRQLPPRR